MTEEIAPAHAAAEEVAADMGGTESDKFAEDDLQIGPEYKVFSVPQHLVPKIMGPGGSTLMMMRAKYEVGVAMNQETKDKGYSVCTIRGNSEMKVAQCKAEIEDIMIGGEGEGPAETAPGQMAHPAVNEAGVADAGDMVAKVQQDLRIPQKFVGMIIGAGGQTIVKIRRHTGAEIGMQQDTANEGYSTAQISGTQEQVDKTVDVLSKMIESGRKAADGYAEYLKAVQHGTTPQAPFKPEKFPGLEFLEDEGGNGGGFPMPGGGKGGKGFKGKGKGKYGGQSQQTQTRLQEVCKRRAMTCQQTQTHRREGRELRATTCQQIQMHLREVCERRDSKLGHDVGRTRNAFRFHAPLNPAFL